MLKLLVPVDGSENSLHAIDHVIKLSNEKVPFSVHLLNVHYEPVQYGDVGVAVTKKQMAEAEALEANPALAAAEGKLRNAGVRYEREVRAGEIPQAIVKRAQDLGCDEIVMGTHGGTAVGNLILGSVAEQVIRLSKVPVTVVK